MGRVTDAQQHCLSLATFQFSGTYVITAANHDTLFGTHRRQLLPDFSFIGMFVTGGTGRFEGASGVVPATGAEVDGAAVVTFNGSISSPGSLK